MTTATTTAPTKLDILDHLSNLDKALRAGGDPAVTTYQTQTLLTDYSNGAAICVFDRLNPCDFLEHENWSDVEDTAKSLDIAYTPQLVADIRAHCEETIELGASCLDFRSQEQLVELWVMQAEALLDN